MNVPKLDFLSRIVDVHWPETGWGASFFVEGTVQGGATQGPGSGLAVSSGPPDFSINPTNFTPKKSIVIQPPFQDTSSVTYGLSIVSQRSGDGGGAQQGSKNHPPPPFTITMDIAGLSLTSPGARDIFGTIVLQPFASVTFSVSFTATASYKTTYSASRTMRCTGEVFKQGHYPGGSTPAFATVDWGGLVLRATVRPGAPSKSLFTGTVTADGANPPIFLP